jgi:ectoine hydroxylase
MITSGTYADETELAAVADDRVSMSFEDFALNRMTEAEKAQFSRDGYLVLLDVLPAADFQRLKVVVRELREEKVEEGWLPEDDIVQPVFSSKNDLQEEPSVMALLLQPRVFPKVVDVLGTNIFCYHSYLVNTRAAPTTATAPPDDFNTVPTFGFHQDSGVQRDIRNAQDCSAETMPRMSLKCAYYLTDQSVPGSGNTWVVPGSMGREDISAPASGVGQPPGAIPVLCPANSVMIFDRRLFHSQSPNYSSAERQVIFVGYGYRWMKPRDAMCVERAIGAATCPLLRQMLGATTQNAGVSTAQILSKTRGF